MNHAIDIDAVERRENWRLKVDCDVYCSSEDGKETYLGSCTSLSSSGLSFICDEPVGVGQELVLQDAAVVTDYVNTLTKSLGATVVRCRRLKDGRFEIGAKIIHPDV